MVDVQEIPDACGTKFLYGFPGDTNAGSLPQEEWDYTVNSLYNHLTQLRMTGHGLVLAQFNDRQNRAKYISEEFGFEQVVEYRRGKHPTEFALWAINPKSYDRDHFKHVKSRLLERQQTRKRRKAWEINQREFASVIEMAREFDSAGGGVLRMERYEYPPRMHDNCRSIVRFNLNQQLPDRYRIARTYDNYYIPQERITVDGKEKWLPASGLAFVFQNRYDARNFAMCIAYNRGDIGG